VEQWFRDGQLLRTVFPAGTTTKELRDKALSEPKPKQEPKKQAKRARHEPNAPTVHKSSSESKSGLPIVRPGPNGTIIVDI